MSSPVLALSRRNFAVALYLKESLGSSSELLSLFTAALSRSVANEGLRIRRFISLQSLPPRGHRTGRDGEFGPAPGNRAPVGSWLISGVARIFRPGAAQHFHPTGNVGTHGTWPCRKAPARTGSEQNRERSNEESVQC
jgi:hypothetical protein